MNRIKNLHLQQRRDALSLDSQSWSQFSEGEVDDNTG